jgi:hypothetical protein
MRETMEKRNFLRGRVLDQRYGGEKLRDKRETNILGKYKLINAISQGVKCMFIFFLKIYQFIAFSGSIDGVVEWLNKS